LSSEIESFLRGKQVECDTIFDGELFFEQIRDHTYEVYLLDVNIPKINGPEVCRIMRKTDKTTPILMLTAFGEVEDKVEAFDFGADDYLVKPFHLTKLLARIRALYRRKETPQLVTNFTEIADLKTSPDEKKVERSGIEVTLTPKEFKLLNILANAKGRVLSK
ncbi:MAG: DNA-binding response OmpR family regulator, partial [Oceanospirillaceae bacterium]